MTNVNTELSTWWDEVQKNYSKTGAKKYIFHSGTRTVWGFLKIQDKLVKGTKVLYVGVGEGICIKELADMGIEIQAVDISPLALKRVEKYIKKGYLVDDLEGLPIGYFDVVIHHLVAQHLSDEYLKIHLKYGIRSLKESGVFAMQFAQAENNIGLKADKDNRGFLSQTTGGCVRTLDEMKSFIQEAKGEVADVVGVKNINTNITWYAIHIVKG